MPEPGPRLVGPVHVVGAGLLGTSVGLAASRAGLEVWLSDLHPEHVRTATGLGAGRPAPTDGSVAQLVVVAVPPDHIADAVVAALATGAVVTDVGSVKGQPLDTVTALVDEEALSRYVGSHPMAGSERSGPLAGEATLFDGRPWAVTPHATADPGAVALVEHLVALCGAQQVTLSPLDHDRAVARTSHLPHLLAVLTAGRLADARPEQLSLSGQGVRDVTRVAAGDPELYGQIIRANGVAVGDLLREVRDELDVLIGSLQDGAGGAGGAGGADGAAGDDGADGLRAVLRRGVAGARAIPGKHGGPARPTGSVFVVVPDTAGELARLFADVGGTGVSIEDLHIDHDPGRPVGHVELVVEASAADRLAASLEARGWVTHR